MYSLRIKLNDLIGKDEQIILENIRRCKQFSGKEFRIIFSMLSDMVYFYESIGYQFNSLGKNSFNN